jgi:hypothetical protein
LVVVCAERQAEAGNAFRNSYLFDAPTRTLWVHGGRLDSVGSFVLVLVHALAHVHVGSMHSDSDRAFQAEFYRCLKLCCAELFYASARANSAVGAAVMARQLRAASVFEAMFAEVPSEREQLDLVQALAAADPHFLDEALAERSEQYRQQQQLEEE